MKTHKDTCAEKWCSGKTIARVIARECHAHIGSVDALQEDWARRINDAVEHGRQHALDKALSIVNKRLAHPEVTSLRGDVSDIFDEIEALTK